MCDVQVKDVAHKQEKAAAQATLNWIRQQEWDEQAVQRKEKGQRVHQHEAR